MADVVPAGSEPVVEAQPELQMEAREAEPAPQEEQGDITLDTTVPLRYTTVYIAISLNSLQSYEKRYRSHCSSHSVMQ